MTASGHARTEALWKRNRGGQESAAAYRIAPGSALARNRDARECRRGRRSRHHGSPAIPLRAAHHSLG